MKIRLLISSSLLAAGLGLGSSTPAVAHEGIMLLRLYDLDGYYPGHYRDRYYDDRHYHTEKHKPLRRHHWRHHDNDRHGGHHHDRGPDYARRDDHDRDRRH
jgi:hypothetical protein